jgi:hypothetical protein
MIKAEWSPVGLWYTQSRKDEEVNHLFRIGYTRWDGDVIYEIIIWKLRIVWG